MPWLVSIVCLLGLIVLFFPFVFRIEFSAKYGRMEARFFFFKKRFYECQKLWGRAAAEGDAAKESDLESDNTSDVDDDFMPEFVPPKPTEKKSAEPVASSTKIVEAPEPVAVAAPAKPSVEPMQSASAVPEKRAEQAKPAISSKPEEKPEEAKKAEEVKMPGDATKPENVTRPEDAKKAEGAKKAEEAKKPEKRSLTDKEFWTILLTPDFDDRAFVAFKRLLGGLLRLFRIRFKDCFVEGIRMRYDHMGYGASVNGFLKSFPLVGDWDIRMDWIRDHELRTAGEVIGKINLCRVLLFLILFLFHGSILGLSFWRRRRHVLRTNELPELGWLRNKIVGWMAE